MMIRSLLLLLFAGCYFLQSEAQQLNVPEYLLYTGKAYVQYPPVQGGSATYRNYHFDSDTELTYHGQHHEGRMLMYDLVLDELIIFHPEKEIPLILPREWIDSFVIKQDTFVNLDQEDWPDLPRGGFYHRYFVSADILCLASYSKALRDEGHDGRRTRFFSESARYFVRKNASEPFQEISTHRQLLRLDPENRRINRRQLFALGLHTKNRLDEAILIVLYNMSQQSGE